MIKTINLLTQWELLPFGGHKPVTTDDSNQT